MPETDGGVPSTASVEGPEWSARARGWADLWAGLAEPARVAVADATAIAAGTRVLDVGCGSGEFCVLAARRGAVVSGIDAAEGMIAIARQRLPAADLRVGPMEQLPWAHSSMDLVTGFNAFQFAADIVAALREAKRVVRPGGTVAICNWGRPSERQLFAVLTALRARLAPPEPDRETHSPPARPGVGEPGVLEDLARAAGLEPFAAKDVDVPFVVPDQATLRRALIADAGPIASEEPLYNAVDAVIADAARPFRRADGSYRFENQFRYVLSRA